MQHNGLRQFRGKCAAAQEDARDEKNIEKSKRRPGRRDRANVLSDEKTPARNWLREKRVDRTRLEFWREKSLPRAKRDKERKSPHEKQRYLVEITRRTLCAKGRRHRKRHHKRKAEKDEGENVVAAPKLDEGELYKSDSLPCK